MSDQISCFHLQMDWIMGLTEQQMT